MSGKVALQPAYVLHLRPFRDTSAIVEALTAEHGRVALVARGARSAQSRWRGVLEPFRSLLLSWSGRGEMYTLSGAEEAGVSRRLRGESLVSGFYLNELLLNLLERNDPHPEIFAAYATAVQALAGGTDGEATLRVFEKRLLEGLGYGLSLDRDAVEGAPIAAGGVYYYEVERGAIPASAGGDGGVTVHGASLLALHSEDLDDPVVRREAKQLMRAVLRHYLGGRALRSRELAGSGP
jgi:DNA repair protein RecO (recombination protein O)